MRLPLMTMILLVLINLVVDWYLYRITKRRCASPAASRIQLFSAVALYVYLIVCVSLPRRSGSDAILITIMWMLFGYLTVYISKYIFVILDLVAKIPCLWHGKRLRTLSLSGGIMAVLTFLFMWWGALVNRNSLHINEVTVDIPGLPQAFDGYRIVQFSDFHVGTYGNDTTYVSKVVDAINALDPDLIAFTGDIVNRRSSELEAFVRPLSRLEATDGVVSILGNHDYGDYSTWPDEKAKEENMEEMYRLQHRIGWNLLRNSHEFVYRDGDSIAVIGVENVGDPPFKCYGSLPEAYPAASDGVTKILLTHNPVHWDQDISEHDSTRIALTLSGHTHAMQMEMAGLSPAALRYPEWGGLYRDHSGKHQLYVNIGLGTVGIPMRLGATPELTVITLRSVPAQSF